MSMCFRSPIAAIRSSQWLTGLPYDFSIEGKYEAGPLTFSVRHVHLPPEPSGGTLLRRIYRHTQHLIERHEQDLRHIALSLDGSWPQTNDYRTGNT